MTAEVVVVSFYSLRDVEAFDRAVRALVSRMKLQDPAGLRGYRFFGSGPRMRRLVAIYETPDAWVRHHNLIVGWPEMVSFRAAARMRRVRLYGLATPEMEHWVERMRQGRIIHQGGKTIPLFRRQGPGVRPRSQYIREEGASHLRGGKAGSHR